MLSQIKTRQITMEEDHIRKIGDYSKFKHVFGIYFSSVFFFCKKLKKKNFKLVTRLSWLIVQNQKS